MADYLGRHIDVELGELLLGLPAIALEGPRAVGRRSLRRVEPERSSGSTAQTSGPWSRQTRRGSLALLEAVQEMAYAGIIDSRIVGAFHKIEVGTRTGNTALIEEDTLPTFLEVWRDERDRANEIIASAVGPRIDDQRMKERFPILKPIIHGPSFDIDGPWVDLPGIPDIDFPSPIDIVFPSLPF